MDYGHSDVTVSGARCRPGSRCRPNPLLGYWYCETDLDGSTGWDYCCQPSHPCGFSEGFSYPWCYVSIDAGSSRIDPRNQWRPCSQRYAQMPYAYLHRQAPPNATAATAAALRQDDPAGQDRGLDQVGLESRAVAAKPMNIRVRLRCENQTTTALGDPAGSP